jgi:hypothetical protein
MGKAHLDSDDDTNSSDDALLEMLGLPSLDVAIEDSDEKCLIQDAPPKQSLDDMLRMPDTFLRAEIEEHNLQLAYKSQSVCIFPDSLSLPDALMRRLADELVWGGDSVQADKTYEAIKVLKHGEITERRTLTRLENFVDHHKEWQLLCHDYLRRCVSAALGEEMVLFKEKLNLKPAGGSGFAPHVDTPSLRVALNEKGPQTFVTLMVAIDNASEQNGCLRIAKGLWSEQHSCEVVSPDQDGNPDAGGRAGAIPLPVADSLDFCDVSCKGGPIVAFNGWAPHRSGANRSPFHRRAVFLTYNPAAEGDYHHEYYQHMEQMRNDWRAKSGLAAPQALDPDEAKELEALNTIPRI